MTWLKCSDDYGDGCLSLDDAEYRTLHEALLWVMRREVGPSFPKRELMRFAETADPETAMAGLVRKGFVAERPTDYEVLFHMQHQVEPEVIARRRENDAERQRRKRRKAAGLEAESRRDNPRDVQRDNPRDPGLVWSGLEPALKESEVVCGHGVTNGYIPDPTEDDRVPCDECADELTEAAS
jgi:hypothetical protein